MMEKDEGWLKNELHKRGYESYKDIFFAEWNELIDDERGKAGELYIVERPEKKRLKRILRRGMPFKVTPCETSRGVFPIRKRRSRHVRALYG